MKVMHYTILAAALVVAAVICAGCSYTPNSAGTSNPAASGTGASSSQSSSAAASSSGTCPVVAAANSWSGSWVSWSNSDPCYDGRALFYPPTADNPDPWDNTAAGVEDYPITFTQTGCDVTGSIVVGPNGTLVAPPGCPISLTGKVDSTGAVSGTWHAYCNIDTYGSSASGETSDSGVWSLNMEPGGSTFVGSFGGADTAKYKADNCANANSNWVGKRA